MWRVLSALTSGLGELIYPSACLVCDAPGSDSGALRHGLCIQCQRAVTADPLPACARCAQTVGPHTDTANGCSECRGTALGFDRTIRLGVYDGALRAAVLRTKVLSGEGLADLLGRVFAESRAEELASVGADVVCPVPLHWWRKWQRGYNQADAVARELAAGLKVGFAPRLLRRVRHTTQHVQTSRSARLDNIKGAFRVRRGARLSGRTVLLVDDVMTTGSTASEAARVLLAAGAERVAVAVLARR